MDFLPPLIRGGAPLDTGSSHIYRPMKAYRPRVQGIREVTPPRKPNGRIFITERTSPTIRSVRGWLLPLEHYDEHLRLTPLQQYLELLLVMASKHPVDVASMQTVLQQARNSLDDRQYECLMGYRPMFDWGGKVTRRPGSRG